MTSTLSHRRKASPIKKAGQKEWVTSVFQNFASEQNTQSMPRKRKFSRNNSFSKPTVPKSGDTWLEKYAPVYMDDLAVHKKKVAEVETFLTQNYDCKRGGAPILLLTGPPGCGKTTTLMVVAKKHGVQVEEWSDPLTIPYNLTKQSDLQYKSEITLFEEFVFRSGKYPSLFKDNHQHVPPSGNSRKLVLLEEFPNFILRDPDYLKEFTRRYKHTQRQPLVIIISDGSDFDPLKRILIPRDQQSKGVVTNISFNPISATLMTKALSRVGSAEHCTLSKDEISNIASTSSGDIRAAINNLQFSSISGSIPKSLKHGKAKPVTLGGKDTSMIMFRALGKIFYCKREKRKGSDSMSSPTHRDDLIVQPEDILDQCCLSGSAFGLFLHQNFLNFFDDNPLEDVAASLEHLSSSDVVGSSITSSDMSTNSRVSLDYYEGVIAARGLTYSNSLRATADLCAKSSGAWRPLHKPAWFQVRRKKQESEIQSHFLFSRMMQADLVLSTLPYLFHLKSHCELNPAQRMFANDIVVLPKWKVYRSENNDRLTEHETGSIETKEVEVKKKLNLDIEPSIQDDDVEIDDFSD